MARSKDSRGGGLVKAASRNVPRRPESLPPRNTRRGRAVSLRRAVRLDKAVEIIYEYIFIY
jgi:hypothetical protein